MNKLQKWWIIIIIAIPFLLMFCLRVGIAAGNYFNININAPDICAEDWFMFMGSYLGGVMTLVGVVITLKYERDVCQYENALKDIDIEKRELEEAICILNVFAPNIFYQCFNSLNVTKTGYNSKDVADIRQRIAEEMWKINSKRLNLTFFTDIDNIDDYSVLLEFQKIYDRTSNEIFGTFQAIDTYIVTCEQNAINRALAENCKENNKISQYLKQPTPYSKNVIDEYESKIVDVTSQQKNINKRIDEIFHYTKNEIPRMNDLARKYIFDKRQNVRKKYNIGKARQK